jgi:hypothetical protein
MIDERKKELRKVVSDLDSLSLDLKVILDEETEECGTKYDLDIIDNVGTLEEAYELIKDALAELENIIENVD